MITRDDATTVARALDSAAPFCDELIVLDLGSRDGTREIAAEHGADVSRAEWNEDYAAARNESFDRCTGEWIMWLGADDVIPDHVVPVFMAFKNALANELSKTEAVIAPYHLVISEDETPVVTLHRERLIRRDAGLRWEGRVNERIVVRDNFGVTGDLLVEHRPDAATEARHRNETIEILQQMYAGGDRAPRTLFHLANELYTRGQYGEATDRYLEYLAADPDGADRYWASLNIAEAMIVMEDPDQARRFALETLVEDPSRAEAYVVLGRLYFDVQEWNEAIPLFTAATGATRPRLGLLREADYTYGPWDYLAVCYEKIGQMPNALAAAQRGLPGNPQAERVRGNMHWMVDQL